MKLICIGRNYPKHIEELDSERPEEPIFFLKPDSAILPKKQAFFIPNFSNNIHYEVELLVKIKRPGKHIAPKFTHTYFDEIGLGIDFTARDLQAKFIEKGLPWEKAKAFDGSAVVSDFVPKSQFKNFNDIRFSLIKNGEIVQQGNSKNMLWKIDELIAYVSKYMTLKIGDIIFTGTPSGVGKVVVGDVLVGKIEDKKFFEVQIK